MNLPEKVKAIELSNISSLFNLNNKDIVENSYIIRGLLIFLQDFKDELENLLEHYNFFPTNMINYGTRSIILKKDDKIVRCSYVPKYNKHLRPRSSLFLQPHIATELISQTSDNNLMFEVLEYIPPERTMNIKEAECTKNNDNYLYWKEKAEHLITGSFLRGYKQCDTMMLGNIMVNENETPLFLDAGTATSVKSAVQEFIIYRGDIIETVYKYLPPKIIDFLLDDSKKESISKETIEEYRQSVLNILDRIKEYDSDINIIRDKEASHLITFIRHIAGINDYEFGEFLYDKKSMMKLLDEYKPIPKFDKVWNSPPMKLPIVTDSYKI